MAGLRRKLEFFYDLLSPYCWLSFEVLCRYQNIWNINLQLRPTFLAGIMKDSGMEEYLEKVCDRESKGNLHTLLVPQKNKYLGQELQYMAKFYQVPLVIPKDPRGVIIDKGSLDAMRFLSSVEMENPEMLEKVSRELWTRVWSQDEDITEPESILSAAEKAGLSEEQAKFLLKKCSTEEVKQKLRDTTNEACGHGAFGLPTIVFNVNKKSHMIFGSDKLELLAYLLGEQWLGPVPKTVKGRQTLIS